LCQICVIDVLGSSNFSILQGFLMKNELPD
jgi:hypothetical protein